MLWGYVVLLDARGKEKLMGWLSLALVDGMGCDMMIPGGGTLSRINCLVYWIAFLGSCRAVVTCREAYRLEKWTDVWLARYRDMGSTV